MSGRQERAAATPETMRLPDYEDFHLFDNINEMVLVIDERTGCLLHINEAGLRRLGKTRDQCEGRLCHEAVRGRPLPCAYCPATMGGSGCVWHAYNERTACYEKIMDAPALHRGRRIRIETCIDMTATLRVQRLLKDTLRMEHALTETVRGLYGTRKLAGDMPKVLASIGSRLGAERALCIKIRNDRPAKLYTWALRGGDDLYRRTDLMDLLVGSPQFAAWLARWRATFLHGASFVIADTRQFSASRAHTYAWFKAFDTRNAVTAPVVLDGRLEGLLSVINLPPSMLDVAGNMLHTVSYFLSTALANERIRERLEQTSYSDEMTGVGNRNAFTRDMDRYRERHCPVGAVYFDLNGLKRINDQRGHKEGDRMIMLLARLISTHYRREDIYRTGGDEFVVICLDMAGEVFAARLAEVRDHLAHALELTVSMGSFWSDNGYVSIQQVVALADESMYREKQRYYASVSREE